MKGRDDRAQSLHHLLDLMQQMQDPPRYIFLENVKGFEDSDSRELLIQTLKKLNFKFEEFLITPTQIGVPNQVEKTS